MLSHPVLVQHLAVRKKAFEDVKLACGAIAHANVHHIQAGNSIHMYINKHIWSEFSNNMYKGF